MHGNQVSQVLRALARELALSPQRLRAREHVLRVLNGHLLPGMAACFRRCPLRPGRGARPGCADRLLEPTIPAATEAVGEARDGSLADVLGGAHTQAPGLVFERCPEVARQSKCGLMHRHSEVENDIVWVVRDIVSDISDRVSQDGVHGELLAEISRSVVRLHKELYGKGPTRARSYAAGDILVCVLAGGFTRAEITLLAAGKAEIVRRQREELQEIARTRFTSTIESITGRPVLAWLSSTDEQAQVSAEVFVLEPREVDAESGDGAAGHSRDGYGDTRSIDGSAPVAESRDGGPPA